MIPCVPRREAGPYPDVASLQISLHDRCFLRVKQNETGVSKKEDHDCSPAQRLCLESRSYGAEGTATLQRGEWTAASGVLSATPRAVFWDSGWVNARQDIARTLGNGHPDGLNALGSHASVHQLGQHRYSLPPGDGENTQIPGTYRR
ncbi:hypothetical protein MRX96_024554 [Rhipicephalus microplus]